MIYAALKLENIPREGNPARTISFGEQVSFFSHSNYGRLLHINYPASAAQYIRVQVKGVDVSMLPGVVIEILIFPSISDAHENKPACSTMASLNEVTGILILGVFSRNRDLEHFNDQHKDNTTRNWLGVIAKFIRVRAHITDENGVTHQTCSHVIQINQSIRPAPAKKFNPKTTCRRCAFLGNFRHIPILPDGSPSETMKNSKMKDVRKECKFLQNDDVDTPCFAEGFKEEFYLGPKYVMYSTNHEEEANAAAAAEPASEEEEESEEDDAAAAAAIDNGDTTHQLPESIVPAFTASYEVNDAYVPVSPEHEPFDPLNSSFLSEMADYKEDEQANDHEIGMILISLLGEPTNDEHPNKRPRTDSPI